MTMSLDDFIWWYWVELEEVSCSNCGSDDVEQIDTDTFKCHNCGHIWSANTNI